MNFTSQSCCKNQIHVLLSHLLHDTQSAKDTRKMILLWYIDVVTDHKTLNISEFDTWSELLTTHQDLVSDFFFSLSLHNLFDISLYSFSVTVFITDLNSISDAFVDRLHWTNFIVIHDLQILLNENNNIQDKYI